MIIGTGDKNYSGPIRALTKWETGVEIDLQTTLAPRSGGADLSLGRDHATDSSLKVGLDPYPVEVVTVEPAQALGSGDGGDWREGTGWTSGTGTEGTASTITRETASRPGRSADDSFSSDGLKSPG